MNIHVGTSEKFFSFLVLKSFLVVAEYLLYDTHFTIVCACVCACARVCVSYSTAIIFNVLCILEENIIINYTDANQLLLSITISQCFGFFFTPEVT